VLVLLDADSTSNGEMSKIAKIGSDRVESVTTLSAGDALWLKGSERRRVKQTGHLSAFETGNKFAFAAVQCCILFRRGIGLAIEELHLLPGQISIFTPPGTIELCKWSTTKKQTLGCIASYTLSPAIVPVPSTGTIPSSL
jgi:hypothetical protein